ncbi:MAG: hypothetical protein L7H18_00755 [Candidatus Nealsonbacteria bacterium DGGOD1a]|nr:MAG: hypothetical protein L7H18_00755 [Candidatus Nealsonbacteria bacterium DGGOD1a]
MNHHLKFYAVAVCALIAVLALCFVAMAWNNPGGPSPTENADAPINEGATAQTKAGDLNLGGKLNVAEDSASGRFCLAGECCATWEECFGVPTPSTCSCGSWAFVGPVSNCGVEDVSVSRQSRDCYPDGCDFETRCVRTKYDPSPAPGISCSADNECGFGSAYGYCCDSHDGWCVLRDQETMSDAEWCAYSGRECGTWIAACGRSVYCGICSEGE